MATRSRFDPDLRVLPSIWSGWLRLVVLWPLSLLWRLWCSDSVIVMFIVVVVAAMAYELWGVSPLF